MYDEMFFLSMKHSLSNADMMWFYSHLPFILVLQPLVKSVAVELQRPLQATLALNLHNGVGIPHHFNESHAVTDWQAPIGQHSYTQN